MIEIFILDLIQPREADIFVHNFRQSFPTAKINLDLQDNDRTFPCGHSILRIEAANIYPAQVISFAQANGYNCGILEDRICAQTSLL